MEKTQKENANNGISFNAPIATYYSDEVIDFKAEIKRLCGDVMKKDELIDSRCEELENQLAQYAGSNKFWKISEELENVFEWMAVPDGPGAFFLFKIEEDLVLAIYDAFYAIIGMEEAVRKTEKAKESYLKWEKEMEDAFSYDEEAYNQDDFDLE